MIYIGLKHSLIYHPDHSSWEFWKIRNRTMEFKEGHTCPGNLGGPLNPSVNEVVGMGTGMPIPPWYYHSYVQRWNTSCIEAFPQLLWARIIVPILERYEQSRREHADLFPIWMVKWKLISAFPHGNEWFPHIGCINKNSCPEADPFRTEWEKLSFQLPVVVLI